MDDRKYMTAALDIAGKNLRNPCGGPFGACIVRKGRIISAARNTVLKGDATCHAEINAIRKASKKLGTFDLSDCAIYSTTEPCPMCFSAIHWAKIKKVVYGTSLKTAVSLGFNELKITCARLKKLGGSRVRIKGGFMKNECLKLAGEWNIKNRKYKY